MNREEAQRAADRAAHRCARLIRALRPAPAQSAGTASPPMESERGQVAELMRATQTLAAAVLELDARVRGVAEPAQTRD